MPRRIRSVDDKETKRQNEEDAAGDVEMIDVDAEGNSVIGVKRQGDPQERAIIDKAPRTGSMNQVPGSEGTLALRAVTDNSGSSGNGQETAVSPYPRVQRNLFTETLTVELPWTGWFSMNNLDKTSPVSFKLRLNSPYDFLKDNTLVSQTVSTVFQKGVSNVLHAVGDDGMAAAVTANNAFPHTVLGAVGKTGTVSSFGAIPAANAIPAFRAWYDKQYESYHVIKTDWSITWESTMTNFTGDEMALFVDYDAYTGTSTGNIIPTTKNLRHYMKWPRVNRHDIANTSINDLNRRFTDERTFSGTWMPGTIMKNTKNEEDIKTWYATGAEPSPNWVENVVFMGMQTPTTSVIDATSKGRVSLNFRVDMKWTVQYKDLKQFYRYMDDDATAAAATNLILPDDIRQIPYTVETIP